VPPRRLADGADLLSVHDTEPAERLQPIRQEILSDLERQIGEAAQYITKAIGEAESEYDLHLNRTHRVAHKTQPTERGDRAEFDDVAKDK
jgi:hypothetical protein